MDVDTQEDILTDTEIVSDPEIQKKLKREREETPTVDQTPTEWIQSEIEGWKGFCGTGETATKKSKKNYSQENGFFILIKNLEHSSREIAVSLADQMQEGLTEENKEREKLGMPCLEFSVFDGDQIRIYPNEMEIMERNRKYRQNYRKLPKVVMQRIKNSKLPEVIQKRREYSSREDVKKRKRLNSTVRRLGLRTLKEINPTIYNTVMNAASSKFSLA